MKRENKKLVYGIGTNDLANDIEKQTEIGLTTAELQKECRQAWMGRLRSQNEGRATVCDEWFTYSKFANWWFLTHVDGWSIDKDLLVAGNKEYHPAKCVWIPQKINCLMCDGRKKNTGLPKGVCIQRKKYKDKVYEYYKAQCSVDGVQEGTTFSTPHEAHRQWQQLKIEEINNVLREYEFDTRLFGRVLQRLIAIRDSIQSDYDNNIETK